jgi:hypothetical protein
LLELSLLSGFEALYTLPIDARTAGITPHFPEGALQVLCPIDLIYQREPFSSFDPSFKGPQH